STVSPSSGSTTSGDAHAGQRRSPGPPEIGGSCQGWLVISPASASSAAFSTNTPSHRSHAHRLTSNRSAHPSHAAFGHGRRRSRSSLGGTGSECSRGGSLRARAARVHPTDPPYIGPNPPSPRPALPGPMPPLPISSYTAMSAPSPNQIPSRSHRTSAV